MNFNDVLARYLKNKEINCENGRKIVETFNAHLAQNFYRGTNILELADDRCYFIDQLLTILYHKYGLDQREDLAVIAVGGYGRKELHPFTDIDVLILTESALTESDGEKVSELITLLWDLKLDVGHAVRTISECIEAGKQDLTIATNLLEKRLICGSNKTYDLLQEATSAQDFWPIKEFFLAKMDEQTKRHNYYKNTMYRLEPDLKNMCGGLRDIQTIMWIARKFTGATKFIEICHQGFMTEHEYNDLIFSGYFIWKVRFALQFVSHRNDNRLTFDRQVAVAKMLGYIGEGNIPVENLMIRFFQATIKIEEINQIILKMYKEAIFKDEIHESFQVLNSKFVLRGTLLDVIEPNCFAQDPTLIMDMLELIANLAAKQSDKPQITGLHPNCIRSFRKVKFKFSDQLENIPKCQQAFISIMQTVNGMLLPLKLMMRYGIMAMYMPEWLRLMGLMQFDMFHTYTVDEHTYHTIANIYNFTHDPELDPSKNLFRNIYRNLPKQYLLYIAALLHDIGKGRVGGHHAEIGAGIAHKFCQIHNFDPKDDRLITWLVGNHIELSNTAQRRDISDPNVISDFANLVQDEVHLDYLYCLTVADICATNDTAWNSWKDAIFKELYFSVQNYLRHDPAHPKDWTYTIEENKKDTLSDLVEAGLDADKINEIWSSFNDQYFLRHKHQIVWQTRNILNYDYTSGFPLVVFGESVNNLGTELFIYMKDQLGIFSKIVSILCAKQISILSANIMNSKDGYIIDSFTLMNREGKPISPEKLPLLRKFLMMNLIKSDFKAPDPGITIPKKYLQFNVPTTVRYLEIKGSEEQGVTHIEVSALDRPGLLAAIANTFQEQNVNIHAARIATTGERADDGFTISLNQKSLDQREKENLRQQLIASIDKFKEKNGQ